MLQSIKGSNIVILVSLILATTMSVVLLLASVALATGNDIFIGTNNLGRKVFDENRHATPAIWTRAENVTVNATNNEVISRIIVTDLRSEKDGQVKIVDGGEGQKTVTLELQSPAAFRGFDFHIEVYTAPEGQIKDHNNEPLYPEQTIQTPEESMAQNPEGDKAPLPPILEIKQIVVPTTSPIFYMTTVNRENENVNANTEGNNDTPNRETTDNLEHHVNEAETTEKTEKDSSGFDGFSRPVRGNDNISESSNEGRDLKGNEDTPSSNPIVVARQGEIVAHNAQMESNNDQKLVNQDTTTDVIDKYQIKTDLGRSKDFAVNSESPQATAEQSQHRHVNTRDTKKEEVPPVKTPKQDTNHQTSPKGVVGVRIFDPIIERRKRQALYPEDKINIYPSFVAEEDVKVTKNDDENVTLFPRTQDINEQSSKDENVGVPVVYYEENTGSPHVTEQESTKEENVNTNFQSRDVLTRDINKEEVLPVKSIKNDVNLQTNPQEDLNDRIFDPIIERRKRQAVNPEDKTDYNPPPFVADEDVKVTNDEENVTLFPRAQEEQSSRNENAGIPIIYYALPSWTQSESISTTETMNQDIDSKTDSVYTKNDNFPPSETPVISK